MIEIEGLHFAHHGRQPVAEGLDLQVPAGEVHLLEGPSGSGKSTLLRIAAGLIPRVQGGRIDGHALVDGDPVHELAPREIPSRVGWMPQDPEESFASRSVDRELGQLARNLDLEAPWQAARSALAELDAVHLLDRDVEELSGGEAARVSLAAAGLGSPDALVLDEPTAQLDAAARKRVAGWLHERAREGSAVLAAEHAPHPLAEIAEDVHRLDGADASRQPRPELSEREPGETLARLSGAVRDFDDDGPAIGPVDVELREGEVACLVGPNGSGKTTALHLLAGLEEPDAGQTRLQGQAPADLEPERLAARVAISFQHPAWHITQDTVAQEIAFTPERLGLHVPARDHLDAFGLEGYADEHPWDLSGGERQRMAVAQASAHEPPVLLLDEPTRGLDPASLEALAGLLRARVRAGKATLVASHHPWMQRLAHRCVHLEGASA